MVQSARQIAVIDEEILFQGQSRIAALEVARAKRVVDRMKELGWTFGSHGYAHLHTAGVTNEKLRSDAQKWVAETQDVVGPTRTYVWPYGETPDLASGKRQLLADEFGFRVFAGVDSMGALEFAQDSIRMERRPIDGYSLRNFRTRYAKFFDTTTVYDAAVHDRLNPGHQIVH